MLIKPDSSSEQTELPAYSLNPPIHTPQTEKDEPYLDPQALAGSEHEEASSFVHVYSEKAREHDIDESHLTSFIDGLDEAYDIPSASRGQHVKQPAISAKSNAGNYLHIVPGPYGAAKSSKANTYLNLANQRLFRPRGLRAMVLTNTELISLIGYPHSETEFMRKGYSSAIQRLHPLSDYIRPTHTIASHPAPSGTLPEFPKGCRNSKFLPKLQKKLDKKEAKWDRKLRRKTEHIDGKMRRMDKGLAKLQAQADKRKQEADARVLAALEKGNEHKAGEIERDLADGLRKIQLKSAWTSFKGERKATRHGHRARWIVITRST